MLLRVILIVSELHFFYWFDKYIVCCRCMIELKCLLYAIPKKIAEDQHMLVQLIGCQVKHLAFLMPNVLRASAYLFWYLTILLLMIKITGGFTLTSYASSILEMDFPNPELVVHSVDHPDFTCGSSKSSTYQL